jgi:hypothetical protein
MERKLKSNRLCEYEWPAAGMEEEPMNLNDDQKAQVKKWTEEGLKLSDIQNKIVSELGIKLTYMEVRLLIDDLQLKPKDSEPVKSALAPDLSSPPPPAPAPPGTAGPGSGAQEMQAPGDVVVSVDQLARPGAIVSGKVSFSDGKKAEWYLDQTGRLGVIPQETGYKPSQADLMLFQGELQTELSKLGY